VHHRKTKDSIKMKETRAAFKSERERERESESERERERERPALP